MAKWFQIALVLNVIYWAIFFYLLSRRRWTGPGLAVGIFHMIFASLVSVAPIRSILDPEYVGYGIGVLHFEKLSVAFPAAVILSWALASAWLAVGKGRGRWMKLVMVGDLFLALSLSVSLILDDSQNWKFQLGEHFTASGVAGLLILLFLFTLPFIASAIWAARRTRTGEPGPPLIQSKDAEHEASEQDRKNVNGFRLSGARLLHRLQYYSILSLAIAILVFSSTTSSQTQEPTTTSRPEQQQESSKPASKFVKSRNPIAKRYIVVLRDDVVSNDASLEVRRAGVTAIANRHAKTYGGKVDYIYETALKGYAIELPNEAAAIAISNLPQVRWVEEDSTLSTQTVTEPQIPESVCRGKAVAVTLLERPFGLKLVGRRTSYLNGGISQHARLVIRERAEFNELWNQMMQPVSDKPPLPEVDFSREMLIVAAMGPKPSPYEIIIDSACEVDNQLEVSVRSTRFILCGANVGLLPLTVDIVRLPKTDLPVVFRETEFTSDCKGVLRPVGEE